MKIGFIGLGNVGGKLAGSLHRNKFDLTVHDLDGAITDQFKSKGVKIAKSTGDLVKGCRCSNYLFTITKNLCRCNAW